MRRNTQVFPVVLMWILGLAAFHACGDDKCRCAESCDAGSDCQCGNGPDVREPPADLPVNDTAVADQGNDAERPDAFEMDAGDVPANPDTNPSDVPAPQDQLADVEVPDQMTEVEVPDQTQPEETLADQGPCIPACGEAECGEDGCGGQCGVCQQGQVCQLGVCLCQPSFGRVCQNDEVYGFDSCGKLEGLLEVCPFGCEAGVCLPCGAPEHPCLTDGFAWLPAGGFWMGSPDGCPGPAGYPGGCEAEVGRGAKEMLHYVTLTRDIEIQISEVTISQWDSVFPGWNPTVYTGCGSECPVDSVSWYDAIGYANRVSEWAGLVPCYQIEDVVCEDGESVGMEWWLCMTAQRKGIKSASVSVEAISVYGCSGYRLPTEAEWERAARAGSNTAIYPSEGNDGTLLESGRTPLDANLDKVAWYGGNSAASYSGANDCVGWFPGATTCGPQPVKGKAPNSLGLYDVLGNNFEWVWDGESEYQSGSLESPLVDPVTDLGETRMNRGGSWVYGAQLSRPAFRSPAPGSFRGSNSFRLVRTLQSAQ